jgi:hypothetical protein
LWSPRFSLESSPDIDCYCLLCSFLLRTGDTGSNRWFLLPMLDNLGFECVNMRATKMVHLCRFRLFWADEASCPCMWGASSSVEISLQCFWFRNFCKRDSFSDELPLTSEALL